MYTKGICYNCGHMKTGVACLNCKILPTTLGVGGTPLASLLETTHEQIKQSNDILLEEWRRLNANKP